MACLTYEGAVEDRSSQGAKFDSPGSSAIMAFRFRPVALRRCFSTALPLQYSLQSICRISIHVNQRGEDTPGRSHEALVEP
jgi:hypothetical protein